MNRYVNVGLVHAMAYPNAAKDAGYYLKTLEDTLKDPYFGLVEIIPPLSDDMYSDVAGMVRDSGFDWVYCATPAQYGLDLDLNSFDPKARAYAVDILRKELENAARLGIKKVQICSGKQIDRIADRYAVRNYLAESVKEVCREAQKLGISVVLEIFDPDIEKKRFLGPSIDSAYVAKEVSGAFDNFGLLQDLSHIPLMYENPYSAVETVKDYLVHTHIGNCVMRDIKHPRYGDTHPIFGSECSEIDVLEIKTFIESLFAVGYFAEGKKAAMSFEIKPWPNEDSLDYIKKAKACLDKAWEMLDN